MSNTTTWATKDVAMATSTVLQSTTVTMIPNTSQSNYTEDGVISYSALVPAAPILGCLVGLLLLLLIVVSAGWVRSHQVMKKHKIILEQIRSNCDQKTVNLDLEGSIQQTTESQPSKDLVLQRNPAYEGSDPQNTIDQEQTQFVRDPIYEETKPQGAIAQEQTHQQSTFEPTYDVILHTQDQEKGSQYNVLDRSVNTPTGADVIPAEAEEGSDYSILQ